LFLQSADYRDSDTLAAYKHTCPSHLLDCTTASKVTSMGFSLFTIIVIAFLATDFADGSLMIYECIRKPSKSGIFAGTLLLFITCYSFAVSFIYNRAVGLSNVEVMTDAAILLFLNEIDEQILVLLEKIVPDWIKMIDDKIEKKFGDNDPTLTVPETNVKAGEKSKKVNSSENLVMRKHIEQLKTQVNLLTVALVKVQPEFAHLLLTIDSENTEDIRNSDESMIKDPPCYENEFQTRGTSQKMTDHCRKSISTLEKRNDVKYGID